MKTKVLLLVIGSPLLLIGPALLAQDNFAVNNAVNSATSVALNVATNLATSPAGSTTTATNVQSGKSQKAFAGEQLLLPPGVKEKLKLTVEQRTELKPIEQDFAATSLEYKVANQPQIDGANEANRQARAAKDKARIQAARTQLQQVWAGLQPYRAADVLRMKSLLTPEQLKVLEDPKNQWREDLAEEAADPSAN